MSTVFYGHPGARGSALARLGSWRRPAHLGWTVGRPKGRLRAIRGQPRILRGAAVASGLRCRQTGAGTVYSSNMRQMFRHAAAELARRPPGNVACLDFLRSLAILLVLSCHVGALFPGASAVQHIAPVTAGWTGVDLFFVLSGFLIGRQLWKELSGGSIRVGRFLLRRGLRIWPLYFSFVLVVWAGVALAGRPAAAGWSDLLCVSNYFHHLLDGGWSLSTEEQFYVLAPVALYVASRRLPARSLVWIPAGCLLALPVVRWAMIGASTSNAAFQRIYQPLFTHADGLAVGVSLAWASVYRPAVLQRSKAGPNLLLLGSGVVVFLLFHRFGAHVLTFTAWAFLYGSLVWAMLRGLADRATGWTGFYVLSRLSYGIYLNHMYLLKFVVPPIESRLGGGMLAFGAGWTAGLALSLAVAFVTFALIELPFLGMRERWLQGTGNSSRTVATRAAL